MNTKTDATPCGKTHPHRQKVTESEAIFLLEVGMEAKLLRPDVPSNIHSTQGNAEPPCDSVPKHSIKQNSLRIFPDQTRQSSENYEIMLFQAEFDNKATNF